VIERFERNFDQSGAPPVSSRVSGVRVGIATLAAAALVVLSSGIGVAEPDSSSTDSTTTTVAPPKATAPAATEVTAQAGPVAYTIIEGDGCRLATVGLTDGLVTAVAGSASAGACVSDLTFAEDGTLYGLIGPRARRPIWVHSPATSPPAPCSGPATPGSPRGPAARSSQR
jgi:hypothetical protein